MLQLKDLSAATKTWHGHISEEKQILKTKCAYVHNILEMCERLIREGYKLSSGGSDECSEFSLEWVTGTDQHKRGVRRPFKNCVDKVQPEGCRQVT